MALLLIYSWYNHRQTIAQKPQRGKASDGDLEDYFRQTIAYWQSGERRQTDIKKFTFQNKSNISKTIANIDA